MFWRYNAPSAEIEALLQKEDVSLQELMLEEELLQECKIANKKVMEFLTKSDVIEELVLMIVSDPSDTLDFGLQFKNANLAAELLTCDALIDKLVQSFNLLQHLYNFFHNEKPLNPILASFVSKVFATPVQRKSERNWYSYQLNCYKVLEFIKSKEDFVDNLINHVGTSAVMDFISQLISGIEEDEQAIKNGIHMWLDDNGLVEKLVDKLSPESESEEHSSIDSILCEICHLRNRELNSNANENINLPNQNILITTLESEKIINKMLDILLKENWSASSIQHVINVLITLFSSQKIAQNLNQRSSLPSNTPKEKCYLLYDKDNIRVVDTIILRLSDIQGMLLQPSKPETIQTAFGEQMERLGSTKLHVVTFVSALICTNYDKIHEKIAALSTIELLLDMFYKFSLNNFLHAQITQAIVSILTYLPIKVERSGTIVMNSIGSKSRDSEDSLSAEISMESQQAPSLDMNNIENSQSPSIELNNMQSQKSTSLEINKMENQQSLPLDMESLEYQHVIPLDIDKFGIQQTSYFEMNNMENQHVQPLDINTFENQKTRSFETSNMENIKSTSLESNSMESQQTSLGINSMESQQTFPLEENNMESQQTVPLEVNNMESQTLPLEVNNMESQTLPIEVHDMESQTLPLEVNNMETQQVFSTDMNNMESQQDSYQVATLQEICKNATEQIEQKSEIDSDLPDHPLLEQLFLKCQIAQKLLADLGSTPQVNGEEAKHNTKGYLGHLRLIANTINCCMKNGDTSSLINKYIQLLPSDVLAEWEDFLLITLAELNLKNEIIPVKITKNAIGSDSDDDFYICAQPSTMVVINKDFNTSNMETNAFPNDEEFNSICNANLEFNEETETYDNDMFEKMCADRKDSGEFENMWKFQEQEIKFSDTDSKENEKEDTQDSSSDEEDGRFTNTKSCDYKIDDDDDDWSEVFDKRNEAAANKNSNFNPWHSATAQDTSENNYKWSNFEGQRSEENNSANLESKPSNEKNSFFFSLAKSERQVGDNVPSAVFEVDFHSAFEVEKSPFCDSESGVIEESPPVCDDKLSTDDCMQSSQESSNGTSNN